MAYTNAFGSFMLSVEEPDAIWTANFPEHIDKHLYISYPIHIDEYQCEVLL